MNDKKMVLIGRELLEELIDYVGDDCPPIGLTDRARKAIEKAPGAVIPVTQAHEWTHCPIFKYTSGENKRCSCYENCPQVCKE